MTTALQAQDIMDDYESDRVAFWAIHSTTLMKYFYDQIEAKSKLGKEATVFSYNDLDSVQTKYLDFIKEQLVTDGYEIGDINGVFDCKW